jgi:hypothetical protein
LNTEYQASPPEGIEPSAFMRLLRKVVDVRTEEVRALGLGFIYYFLIFSSYYVIRPIRAATCFFVSLWLGRKQVRMTREAQASTGTPLGN